MQEQFSHDDDSGLTTLAIETVLTMMASASTDLIAPKDWWSRARSALEAAAAMAETPPLFFSKMAQKLQIHAPTNATASRIEEITRDIADRFDQFCYLCQRDAFFIVAMAQAEREQRRKSKPDRQLDIFGGVA